MYSSFFKKTLTIALEAALVLGVIVLMTLPAQAQSSIGSDWDQFLDGVKGFQGVSAATGGSGEDLAESLVFNGVRIVRNVIGAVALVLAVLYAASLIMARGNEETIANQKKNFMYMFMGFIAILTAEQIARIFNPLEATSEKIIDFQAASDQLRNIANYLKWFLGSIMALVMTVSGLRMITAQGDEEVVTSQKNHLLWAFMGGLVILLADSLVRVVYDINEEGVVAGAAGAQSGIDTLTGLIKLALAFVGPLAIIYTIYAGYIFLTSLQDEEQTAKAKKMIVGGITGIVIIYSAYAIVNTFLLQTPTA